MAEKNQPNKSQKARRAPISSRLSDDALRTLFGGPRPQPASAKAQKPQHHPQVMPRSLPKTKPKPESTQADAPASKLPFDPVHFMQSQLHLWEQYAQLWQSTTTRFLGGETLPLVVATPGDKRFRDKAWDENPLFDFIKQSYLLTSRWLQGQVMAADMTDAQKKKLDFVTRQVVDALSPTNFALTNPAVLKATLESKGENLLAGYKNLLDDMQKGRLTMTDESAFTVGGNLATTPGKVVFRNRLFELIQYTPTTPQVAKRPLLIVPPWINKFYILDMKPENSFIKWAVDSGLTVFCVSWVNPDAAYRDVNFDDYMSEGLLAALKAIEQEVNVIGYCLGGTLLAATQAYLAKADPKRLSQINSVTYFTTMIDFAEPGELGVFIDEGQLEAIEAQMAAKGYLEAKEMQTTFNLMRANDLIWSFVVNNYLLGKQPFPFDLLYWNSDSTRLPAAMHSFYLRKMYMENLLAKKDGLKFKGVSLDLHEVKTPSYILATREDHIAPWASSYLATQIYQGPMEFVLAGSGHIAGVVNPPAANKYQYWTNTKLPAQPQAWLEKATAHEGSWWPHWRQWLSLYAGELIDAPEKPIAPPLCDAPGEYVKIRAV